MTKAFLYALCAGMLFAWLMFFLTGCATNPEIPADFDFDKGYLDPPMPPNCWVQPPNSEYWYVCGHAPEQLRNPTIPHHGGAMPR